MLGLFTVGFVLFLTLEEKYRYNMCETRVPSNASMLYLRLFRFTLVDMSFWSPRMDVDGYYNYDIIF